MGDSNPEKMSQQQCYGSGFTYGIHWAPFKSKSRRKRVEKTHFQQLSQNYFLTFVWQISKKTKEPHFLKATKSFFSSLAQTSLRTGLLGSGSASSIQMRTAPTIFSRNPLRLEQKYHGSGSDTLVYKCLPAPCSHLLSLLLSVPFSQS